MFKDLLINLLLDNVAVPCDVAKDLIDRADTNGDGRITLREFYQSYRDFKARLDYYGRL